jgi:rubredoxin
MKCPYCGDEDRQRDWGEIKRQQAPLKLPAVILYRCENCAYLYTVPPIGENDQPAQHEGPPG